MIQELPGGEVSPFLVRNSQKVKKSKYKDRSDASSSGSPLSPSSHRFSSSQADRGLCRCSQWPQHVNVSRSADFRLLYSVRSPRDEFFADELAELSRTIVEIVHTRESAPGAGRPPRRLTREALIPSTFPASLSPRIFVCGPTPFVEAVAGWLVELGHDPAQIRTERFGGSP